jgi:hypothetical protein
METILSVSAVALICMCVLGYIVGSFFSQAFEEGTPRAAREVEEPRDRKIGVIYPVRRRVALQRAA